MNKNISTKKYFFLYISRSKATIILVYIVTSDNMQKRRYLIYCNTEAAYIEAIRVEGDLPTQCPRDATHSVNPYLTTDNGSYQDSTVKVTENLSLPVGTFRAEQWKIDIPSATTYSRTFQWPIDIIILNFQLITTDANEADKMEITVAPNTTVGIITSNAPPGTTTFSVQPSVFNYLQLGYSVNLFNGVNNDDLGMVISINKDTNTIITEKPTTHTFSAASPTYIQMSVKTVTNFEFGPRGLYNIGVKKLGGRAIPANIPVVLTYTNNTSVAKKFWAIIEYLY